MKRSIIDNRHLRMLIIPFLILTLVSCSESGGDADHAPTDTSDYHAETSGATASEAGTDSSMPGENSGEDRMPNFEGIPNFEDVVAMREGDWIVVLTSVDGVYVKSPGRGQAAGSVMKSEQADIARVQQNVWNRGLIPWVVASDEFPNLESGRTLLILGPYPKEIAEAQLAKTSRVVPGARLELAWAGE